MKNLKRQFTFIGSIIALTFLVWGAPVSAIAPPPDLVDVVEITDPAPFIVHMNILPGDSFLHPMTVKNLTGTSQNIGMKLDVDLSQGIPLLPPNNLEEQIFVKIERVDDTGFIELPGGGQEKTLQMLDDTVIELGSIPGGGTQVYNISFVFNRDAGNEYQNTKVYFNVAIGLEIPEVRANIQVFKGNGSVAPEAPGNEVAYTLRVIARDGDVNGVTLTDLPSPGFKYKDGTWTAHSSFETDINPFTNHTGVLGLSHLYASPGVWDLGNMQQDEVVTLTYSTTISASQDDGLYKDLAFAEGNIGEDEQIFAIDPNDSDNFVGTEVVVVTPTSEAVQLKEKDKTDTTTKRIIKRVLGASILPATGAQISWVILALVLFVSGLGMMMYSKRKKALAMKNLNEIITKILFLFVFGASVLALPFQASASTIDPHISVRIEAPESPSMESAFNIGFVTLDIEGRNLTVQCFKSPAAVIPDDYVVTAGGNSGSCLIDLPDGTYQFYVRASYDDGEDTISENVSEMVTVEIKAGTPGTPLNYNREKNSCGVSFTTANDGLTMGVELYRSTESSFVADVSTLATTLAIGPNMNGAMIDPGADCRDYFYAIRAVSITGAGSGFVGDDDVNVKHETNTKTTTVTTPGAASAGAIAVTGAGAEAGQVQGAETTNEETVPDETEAVGGSGSVLGEMTEAVGDAAGGFSDWIRNHPWWSALIALIVLALLYYGYGTYPKKRNEPLQ